MWFLQYLCLLLLQTTPRLIQDFKACQCDKILNELDKIGDISFLQPVLHDTLVCVIMVVDNLISSFKQS